MIDNFNFKLTKTDEETLSKLYIKATDHTPLPLNYHKLEQEGMLKNEKFKSVWDIFIGHGLEQREVNNFKIYTFTAINTVLLVLYFVFMFYRSQKNKKILQKYQKEISESSGAFCMRINSDKSIRAVRVPLTTV